MSSVPQHTTVPNMEQSPEIEEGAIKRIRQWLRHPDKLSALFVLERRMRQDGLVIAGGLVCRALLAEKYGDGDGAILDGADADFFWIRDGYNVPTHVDVEELCDLVGADYFVGSRRVVTMHFAKYRAPPVRAYQFVMGIEQSVERFARKADIPVAGFVLYWNKTLGELSIHGTEEAWEAISTRSMPAIDPSRARFGTPKRILKYSRAPFSFHALLRKDCVITKRAPEFSLYCTRRNTYGNVIHRAKTMSSKCPEEDDDVRIRILLFMLLCESLHLLHVGPKRLFSEITAPECKRWETIYLQPYLESGETHRELVRYAQSRFSKGVSLFGLRCALKRMSKFYTLYHRRWLTLCDRDTLFFWDEMTLDETSKLISPE